MDAAETPRTGPSFRFRLAAASPWPRRRIAGEAVLTPVLSGIAGILRTAETGSLVQGGALALFVAVVSLARRALPASALLAASALAGAFPGAFALLVCTGWSAGSRIERPVRALAAFAAGFGLHLAADVATAPAEDLGLPALVTVVLAGGPFLMLVVAPAFAARYRAQRHALLDALRRHNAQLVRERAMVARQARLLERQRIAQDMHDSLGHQLALIAVHTGALEVDPQLNDRQREGVGVLREASRSAMRELRETVGILRNDAETSGPGPQGAGPSSDRAAVSVDELVASSRAAGATVELHRSGAQRPLTPAADRAAYRIAQEGLTNAHKHAPGAPITVALRYEPDSLVVEVANGPVPAGVPAAPPAIGGQQGLTGLRERARLVGGMVHTGSTPGGGFRLAGVLPYAGGERQSPPGGATSVAADDDFREQSDGVPAGNSGGVLEHAVMHKEFTAIMSSKKNVALGCAATAVVLVVGLGALLVWGVSKGLDEWEKGTIPASVYEGARVGEAEADLRKKLPEGGSILTEGEEKKGPPLPDDADCEHFTDDEKDITYRFCFRDGKLASKVSYAWTP
ncbi:two-component sensor histidine kinase [Streptomyces olivaceus]|uniref:histidine kinase n=1 Tax=Streptomyces olivaceus TaxID=47716 RepID=A0ABS7WEH5_STROV|nr:histidine kinase [Streptomyces olivaceus]MBZ6093533.1 two-component sensor histidine kinase [Streptomyces olivaceus]MBZ6100600.1 two-component sensor histidine kinase [Streptomyces olivaceus]MBZ6121698.1 two-component sensor histidine kinase [Streptomyces olivaceus]MBZ6156365.1 two-component sensor histidine kinase [Streptomyces olivaceus]MBZ6204743.1 two-component sensor histidine kinase [Streptomyces olivaceus]